MNNTGKLLLTAAEFFTLAWKITIAAAALLFGGCTIRDDTPAVRVRYEQQRPAVNVDIEIPRRPLPQWNDPLEIRPHDDRSEMAMRIDRLRSRNGRSYLFVDPILMDVAQRQADYLARTGQEGHQGPGGSWPADRVRAAGYPAAKVGENMAGDFSSVTNAINGWLQSPGHKRTMLDPEFTQAGYGIATGRRGKVYVALFARPK